MRMGLICGLVSLLFAPGIAADNRAAKAVEVDLELVLASDVSGSVSPTLAAAQRAGFAEAFRDPRLGQALFSGPNARVVVTYFEWAGAERQQEVVGWTMLEDAGDMATFAEALAGAAQVAPGGETSLSGALVHARHLIDTNDYEGLRRVIDIASNGINSEGPPMAVARVGLWEQAVTVNGLVLPDRDYAETGPYATLFTGYDGALADYFEREVIGGPGAFVQRIDPDKGFETAILRKLVLEVAWSLEGNPQ